MSERRHMAGLGEVLWDLLPSGKVLGGAPTNFAYMSTVLGNLGVVLSRVGNDDLGRQACQEMSRLNLNTDHVQTDRSHGTGTAVVSLDDAGQPKFTIREQVAWDFLEWTPAWKELSTKLDAVCFGSLAQRSPASAATIECFLQNTSERTLRICDVNLREPFYSLETLRRSFRFAEIVKLNDLELLRLRSMLGRGDIDEIEFAKDLLKEFHLKVLCITRGAHGSLLVSENEIVSHPGFKIEVADAVGAGDAFTACVAHFYLEGRTLGEISICANRFAAWVATQTGATPPITRHQLEELLGLDMAPQRENISEEKRREEKRGI